MKGLKIAAGIAFVIGIFLLLCVAGADDYALEMGIKQSTNFVLAGIAFALILPAPFILNLPERNWHGTRKDF